jgi:hypothetical protein
VVIVMMMIMMVVVVDDKKNNKSNNALRARDRHPYGGASLVLLGHKRTF